MGILVGVPAPGDDVPVVRGVDFAPDSVEGAGSEFYFIPDSGEEVSSELQVLPVVDSKIVPDSLAEDLGSKDVVVAEVDASGAKLDAAAKVGRVEVRDAKVDGPFVDLSGGTDEVADVAASACMDDVLGSEYVVNEDMETQEEWIKGKLSMDPEALQILTFFSLDVTTILTFNFLSLACNITRCSFIFISCFKW